MSVQAASELSFIAAPFPVVSASCSSSSCSSQISPVAGNSAIPKSIDRRSRQKRRVFSFNKSMFGCDVKNRYDVSGDQPSTLLDSVPAVSLSSQSSSSSPKWNEDDLHSEQAIFKAADEDSDEEDPAIVSRRNAILASAAWAWASLFQGSAAYARGEPRPSSLEEALVPVVESQEILRRVPELVKKEQWDGVRTLLFRPPVGQLKSSMSNAADFLGENKDDALEEYYDILEHLREVDVNVYTNIFVPSSESQVKYTKLAMSAYEAAMQNLDKFFALVPPEKLELARKKAEL